MLFCRVQGPKYLLHPILGFLSGLQDIMGVHHLFRGVLIALAILRSSSSSSSGSRSSSSSSSSGSRSRSSSSSSSSTSSNNCIVAWLATALTVVKVVFTSVKW